MNGTTFLYSQRMQWLQVLVLTLVLTIAFFFIAQTSHAQLTGNLTSDKAIINSSLAATIAATGKNDAKNSRIAMQELYRQWLLFRAKNFADPANSQQFVPRMKKVETALFAASKLVDSGDLAKAQGKLQNAQKLFQAGSQPSDTVKPATNL